MSPAPPLADTSRSCLATGLLFGLDLSGEGERVEMVETESDEEEDTERERERERLREDLWPSMSFNERLRGLAEASLEGF